MGLSKCLPLDDPRNQWSYCPSVPAAVLFFALFALTTLVHFIQAIRYRKAFCWVIIMGGLWETLSFAARIISARNHTQKGSYDASFLLVLLAPLSINAFDYMLLGRLMQFFLPGERLMGIAGSSMGYFFVCFDIVGYLPRSSHFALHGTFGAIQFSSPQGSSVNKYIEHHEFFLYVFDSLPMFIALVLMNIWHAGKVLNNKEVKFPQYDGTLLQAYGRPVPPARGY
ncbi:hypothetical protein BKA64DRAFT_641216 [Cadophora sp. MPI-SDFR-AT-0126]|nr:hypothetical protein BKA64DRAFT_641216 [Leotiomycetes sp. MPI-SDFR-AT-0126]